MYFVHMFMIFYVHMCSMFYVYMYNKFYMYIVYSMYMHKIFSNYNPISNLVLAHPDHVGWLLLANLIPEIKSSTEATP